MMNYFINCCNDTYILQRGDWSSHKAECAGLKRLQEREHAGMPTDTMRLVLRLVVMAMASASRQLELDSLISSMVVRNHLLSLLLFF